MPSNAITAAIIAALAPIVAAVVVLFKLDLTQDQQAELVAGLAGIVTVGGTIYAAVATHANAKVKAAVASAPKLAQTAGFTTSAAPGITYTAPAPPKPTPRKRPSRAKPKPPSAK